MSVIVIAGSKGDPPPLPTFFRQGIYLLLSQPQQMFDNEKGRHHDHFQEGEEGIFGKIQTGQFNLNKQIILKTMSRHFRDKKVFGRSQRTLKRYGLDRWNTNRVWNWLNCWAHSIMISGIESY
ncbi:hypothetical protein QYF61_013196 [Mycteria americana]|uniref:Uncharacterized protein n=1 Tax=Mycteria americana TaxID=33587 RepID=A0AAN7SI12_MYCAM|nr:hypothetical protein QYF61_013196 [Mycteria americana]